MSRLVLVVACALVDADGRILIAEEGGTLRVVKDGSLLATPALTIAVNSQGERGLIGVTADPDFATNHFIYVYHTVPTSPIHNQVSRFTMNGDVADAGSEVDILDIDPLSSQAIHNGGALHFGADGKLYVATGAPWWQSSGGGSGLYVSSDKGNTWTTIAAHDGQNVDPSIGIISWKGRIWHATKQHVNSYAGDEAGSKLAKAEQLGVAILDYAGLQRLLGAS